MGARARLGTAGVATMTAGMLLAAVVGASVAAQIGARSEGAPQSNASGRPLADSVARAPEVITTGGTSFDPTILTTFIPGTSFVPYQGTSLEADLVRYESPDSACVSADSTSGGQLTELRHGVHLPDGARIKQLRLFGQDDDAIRDIGVRLSISTVEAPAAGPVARSFVVVDSFDTFGVAGTVAIAGADNLDRVVGSSGTTHVFATLHVQLANGAAANHKLCGVEVEYQVPIASPEGSVFHPVSPYRAYDSRLEMAPVADGPLARGQSRLVPVKDGRNVQTGVIDRVDAIPANATAVAYTVTAASPAGAGFLFVGPGDATGVAASSLNWDGNLAGAIANSAIVKLDGNRRVKVFAGGLVGMQTNFVIDITGYFAPPVHPNMGN